MYNRAYGETIRDVLINTTGNINGWNDLLNANNFDSWTPDLYFTENIITINAENEDVVTYLKKYPICQITGFDLNKNTGAGFPYQLPFMLTPPQGNIFSNLDRLLATAQINEYQYPAKTDNFIKYYEIKHGETIRDVVVNSTGSIDNWDLILTDNDIKEWNPNLENVNKLKISSDSDINKRNTYQLKDYPINNNNDSPNINIEISELISIFETI